MNYSPDKLDVLGIDTSHITKFLLWEATIEGLPTETLSEEKIKRIFIDSIEADIEELED